MFSPKALLASTIFLSVEVALIVFCYSQIKDYQPFCEGCVQSKLYHWHQSLHPVLQLAFWENLVTCFLFWLICHLFFGGKCWLFDPHWPFFPIFAWLFYSVSPGGGNSTLNTLQLILSVIYAIKLNGNYFRTFGWSCVGEEDCELLQVKNFNLLISQIKI